MDGIRTFRQALRYVERQLAEAGIEEARREAELLVCNVAQCSMLDVLLEPERVLSAAMQQQLSQLVHIRITERVPLQYLLGWVEFYGLRLRITSAVLIPRPETEFLIARLVAAMRASTWQPRRILDIGTGSGCIALALAKEFPGSCVIGWDCDEAALSLAEENAQRLGIPNVSFEHVDVLQLADPDERFWLVVSNPPYIPACDVPVLPPEVQHEPTTALTDGADGLTFYRHYSEHLQRLLEPNGIIALECNDGQAAAVAALFTDMESAIGTDQRGVERYVLAAWDCDHRVLRNFSLQNVHAAS